jgi:hypothetical protein
MLMSGPLDKKTPVFELFTSPVTRLIRWCNRGEGPLLGLFLYIYYRSMGDLAQPLLLLVPVFILAQSVMREKGLQDPLVGILPITREEIARKKFQNLFLEVMGIGFLLGLAILVNGFIREKTMTSLNIIVVMMALCLPAAGLLVLYLQNKPTSRTFRVVTWNNILVLLIVVAVLDFLVQLGPLEIPQIDLVPWFDFLTPVVALIVLALGVGFFIWIFYRGPWRVRTMGER